MLEVIRVENISQKMRIYESTAERDRIWVIADLKSKTFLQLFDLKKTGYSETHRVRRAQELWRDLIDREALDLRIIDDDVARALIRDRLRSREEPWATRPGAASTVFKYINYFLPVIVDGESLKLVRDYCRENTASFERWGHWFIEALNIWSFFLEQKIIARGWIHGALTQVVEDVDFKHELFFDLGTSLLPTEFELIRTLSRKHSVTCIAPTQALLENYLMAQQFYDLLSGSSRKSVAPAFQLEFSSNVALVGPETRRFTTMIAEVKDAVAQVKAWTLAGLEPFEIAIVAPDIGLYWEKLEMYLRTEGIAVARSLRSPLSSLACVQDLVGRMKIKSPQVSQHHLKAILFGQGRASASGAGRLPSIAHFESVFDNFFDARDVAREENVKNYVETVASAENNLIDVVAFLKWAEILWSYPQSSEIFQKISDALVEAAPSGISLSVDGWISVLEKLALRIEVESTHADARGVQCIDLASSDYLQARCIYILGLTNDALRRDRGLHVLDADVEQLLSLVGSRIPPIVDTDLEFDLNWLLDRATDQIILSFPESDFQGTALGPALPWLKFAKDYHAISPVGVSAWDQMATRHEVQILDRLRSQPDLTLKNFSLDHISATGIEDYLKCPFIFYAARVLRLGTTPALDLDVDSMTQGRFYHTFIEEMLAPGAAGAGDLQHFVGECLDRTILKIKMQFIDENMKSAYRERMVTWGLEFLSQEARWKSQFPKTEIVGHELEVSGYLNPVTGEFSLEALSGHVPFRGSIDRVDTDGAGQFVIVDYKTSGARYSNWQTWVAKKQLQLALYAMALEKGLVKDIPIAQNPKVVGMFYYFLKDFDRLTGLGQTPEVGTLAPIDDRRKNKATVLEVESLFVAIKAEVALALGQISNGNFTPKPYDESICETCRWRHMCRAPHLV